MDEVKKDDQTYNDALVITSDGRYVLFATSLFPDELYFYNPSTGERVKTVTGYNIFLMELKLRVTFINFPPSQSNHR